MNRKKVRNYSVNKDSMDSIVEVFKNRDKFLITAHVNPEGDSIGSQLACRHILEKMGKETIIVNHDNIPDNLRFLSDSGSIRSEAPADIESYTIVVLDCPVRERIGRIQHVLTEEQFIVNIDHHVSNEFFGDVNWVESKASSVGEMIFHLAKKLNIGIEKDLAAYLYTAIVTDTGMFNYANTSPVTHEVVAELIDAGVNPQEVHSEIFENKSIPEVKLLGKALTTLKVEAEGGLAYMCLTSKMYREEGVDYVSTDEYINFARSIRGVDIAVFFKENVNAEERINVSFRSSEKVNVNIVASRFGGGGHARAAGCVLDCTLSEAMDRVLSESRKTLEACRKTN